MVIPKMEIPVMIEINPCFLFAFRYLKEKNVSKDIVLHCFMPARHRTRSGEAGGSVAHCPLFFAIHKLQMTTGY